MQVNRTTDYALRILVYLSQENRVVPSSEMANNMGISQRYLLSVAHKLKENKYIDVGLGSDGGYTLARPMDQITLYDVIAMMEGKISISRCLTQEKHCGGGGPCVLHSMYCVLQTILVEYLRSVTVDTLINRSIDDWKRGMLDQIHEMQIQFFKAIHD